MDENEFRASLRVAVQNQPVPPPMRAADAMLAGRRAGRRRTAMVTAAGVVAMTVLTGGALVGANRTGERSHHGGSSTAGSAAAPSGSASASASTSARPQDELAQLLLNRLVASAPAGWTVTDPQHADNLPQKPAAIATMVHSDGMDLWQYSAAIELKRNGMTKLFLVEVDQPGVIPASAAGCALTKRYWVYDVTASCRQVRGGATEVPLMAYSKHAGAAQWAAYRAPDGVVVTFAQVAQSVDPGQKHSAAPSLPLTQQQLTALVMDGRFHVTD